MMKETKKTGRPSMGVTKKMSLTLSEDGWKWLEEQARGNSSQFLRNLVWDAQSPEGQWSNQACLGYGIMAAIGIEAMNDVKMKEFVSNMHRVHDELTIDEAKKCYTESPY